MPMLQDPQATGKLRPSQRQGPPAATPTVPDLSGYTIVATRGLTLVTAPITALKI